MTSTAMTAPALKDLYEIGEIPPAYHVPARMHAWTIRKERHGASEKSETSRTKRVAAKTPVNSGDLLDELDI